MYDNKKQDSPNLFHGLEVWAEPAMAAEDFLVNDRSNRQARGKMYKIFQIFLLKSFEMISTSTLVLLRWVRNCTIGQMHKCTIPQMHRLDAADQT